MGQSPDGNALLKERHSYNYNNIEVGTFLDSLSKKFDLKLFYSSTNLDLNQVVKVQFKNVTLEELFDKLFFKTRIQMQLVGNKVVLKYFDGKLYQNIRGRLLDADSREPLMFANVACISCQPQKGASTDENGDFVIYDVPIGMHIVMASYIGYSTVRKDEVRVLSAKETVIELAMEELVSNTEEVIITSKKQVNQAVNSMATGSVRMFNISEAQNYGGGLSDPARMTMSFPGTIMGSNGLFNEVSIRGNAGNKLMWRFEGLEIVSPAHFNREGSSGGIISMLNSTTMANSDFYSSLFPAQFGNAISGVFDLRLKNGSSSKREYEAKIGIMGLEFGTEGPFKKGKRATYVFNYRLSSTSIINNIVEVGANYGVPTYWDFSYKFYLPTKKIGVFSLFGLNGSSFTPAKNFADSSTVRGIWDLYYPQFTRGTFTNGLKHNYIVNSKLYFNSVLGMSRVLHEVVTTRLHDRNGYYPGEVNTSRFNFDSYQFNSFANWKINKKNVIRIGTNNEVKVFDYFYERKYEFQPFAPFNAVDSSSFLMDDTGAVVTSQWFAQHKYKISNSSNLNIGINAMFFSFNNEMSIDPRVIYDWGKDTSQWKAGIGKHTRKEPLSTLLLRRNGVASNTDLKMVKSWQAIFGNTRLLKGNWVLKNEIYFQYHYDVGVEADRDWAFSNLNMFEIYSLDIHDSILNMDPTGMGLNYGYEVALEKSLEKGYYSLVNLALYQAKFSDNAGNWHNSQFSHDYIFKIVTGKEIKLGPNKKNTLNLNIRFISSGGNWHLGIDRLASIAVDDPVYDYAAGYSQRGGAFRRIDVGFKYTVNNKKVIHSIVLDVLNANSNQAVIAQSYDDHLNEVNLDRHYTIVPFATYSVKW